VEEAYRGAGIGKYLLDNINDLFSRSLNYSHHVCVLKPYPQVRLGDNSLRDKEGVSPEEAERLAAFYQKAGYKFIQGSDYMYKIQADTLMQLLGI
jgi:GNAT superfamily N-acetyltransferase